MSGLPALTFAALAEAGLLIRLGDVESVDPATVEAVWALTAALDQAKLPGVIDIVPAYATILLGFDLWETDPTRLEAGVRRVAASVQVLAAPSAREATIPVAYGGGFGPDLGEVAAHTGLSPHEVVTQHAAAEYRVACMGFAPGWAYLLGLPPELATPRLPNPRMRIPAGSVGIGGAQTGVYPLETPGGWRLIGRTPLQMFDPARAEPFLLRPGDRVHFCPIDQDAYAALEEHGDVVARGPMTLGEGRG